MSTEHIAGLLDHAGERWTTAKVTARKWRRQELVDVAFHRHFDAVRATGAKVWTVSFVSENDRETEDQVCETVFEIVVDQAGRRCRSDLVLRRNEDGMPETLVINGDSYWARTGNALSTNGGDPNNTHGGADVVALLRPDGVTGSFDLVEVDEVDTVADRRCAVVVATMKPFDPAFHRPGSELFDMVAGGDAFRLSVDLETGAILRVAKIVDDQVAEVCEFIEITWDLALDDELFGALG